MPFVNRINPQPFGMAPELPIPPIDERGAFAKFALGATAGAADFGAGSVYVEHFARQMFPEDAPEPGFNFMEHIDGYEEFADEFVGAENATDIRRKKFELDLRQRARQDIASTGGWGYIGMMASGLVDPTLMVPGAVAARLTTRIGGTAGRIFTGTASATKKGKSLSITISSRTKEDVLRILAKRGIPAAAVTFTEQQIGASVLSAAARGAIIGSASIAGGAAVTGLTNELYSIEEAVLQIGGGAILGGVLGAGGRALANRRLARTVEDELELPASAGRRTTSPEGGISQAGAAATPQREAVLAGSRSLLSPAGIAIRTASKLKLFPFTEAATSPAGATRRAVQELAETNMIFEEFAEGIASPVAVGTEVRMNVERGLGWTTLWGKQGYKKYAKRLKGLGEKPMRLREFSTQVSKAMRRSDHHHIPEVQAYARKLRGVMDEWLKRGIKAGVFAKELADMPPLGATSYLTRLYNSQKIYAHIDQWVDALTPWIARKYPHLDPDEYADVALQIADTIGSGQRGRTFYGKFEIRGTRRPTKARVLDIEDSAIEFFLEDDIFKLMRFYLKTMVPDIVMAERPNFGGPLMEGVLGREGTIELEYRKLISQAKTPKARQKLAKRKQRDMELLEGMRDTIRGTQGLPKVPDSVGHRISLGFRRVAVVTKLGGVVVSSITDPASIVVTQGFARTFEAPIRAMAGRLRGISKQVGQVRLADRRDAGTAFERVLNSRPKSLYDFGDDYGSSTLPEKGLVLLADRFGRWSTLSMWNHGEKTWVSLVHSNRVLKTVERLTSGKRLTKDDRIYLSQSFIDDEMAGRIAKQFTKHGEKGEDGLYAANGGAWTDREAARIMQAGTKRAADKTIQSPSEGDLPLLFRNQVGALVGVARSFSFATTQNILLAGLQRHDRAFAIGFTMSLFLGMTAFAMKSWLSGRELPDDPAIWASEGFDRSGMLGLIGDVNFAIERMSGNRYGIAALFGAPPLKRRIGADLGEIILGIPYSQLNDVGDIVGDLMQGRSPKAREFIRLVPYANLWYIQGVMRAIEEANQ